MPVLAASTSWLWPDNALARSDCCKSAAVVLSASAVVADIVADDFDEEWDPYEIKNLESFIKSYPADKNIAYAHYLIAICYYESIEDEKRDTGPLMRSREKFNYLIENYPNSDFSLDAKFKLELINDILASKEVYLGR